MFALVLNVLSDLNKNFLVISTIKRSKDNCRNPRTYWHTGFVCHFGNQSGPFICHCYNWFEVLERHLHLLSHPYYLVYPMPDFGHVYCTHHVTRPGTISLDH